MKKRFKKTSLVIIVLTVITSTTAGVRFLVYYWPGKSIESVTLEYANIPESVTISSDYPHYSTIRDLSDYATDIVMGRIVSSRVDELFILYDSDGNLLDKGRIYTIHTLQILDIYKGIHTSGDLVEIKQPGGTINRVTHIALGEPTLSNNNNYVFFLHSGDYTVPASYLNPTQSIYFYDTENRDLSRSLVSISENNNLDITYAQLNAIAERMY